jgi:hypothetical protein
MPSIRLHPKDCEKYGAPEVIDIDFQAIGMRQRSAVEKASGKSLRWMYEQLQGVPELDEHQNPIPVTDRTTGELVLVDGQPVPRLQVDPEAWVMLVWMALWGNGIKVPWNDFDIIESGFVFTDEAEDEDPGKGEAPTDSESTTTS